eukprot:190199_1
MATYDIPNWCFPVFIGLTVINECILIPLMIYYTSKFWKLRNDIFFAKRRPVLILTTIICMGINPLLRPLMLYEYWYGTDPFWIKMMNFWPYALAFTVAFLRFWLTLYDFKYNEALYLQKIKREVSRNDKSIRSDMNTIQEETPYEEPCEEPTIKNTNTNSNEIETSPNNNFRDINCIELTNNNSNSIDFGIKVDKNNTLSHSTTKQTNETKSKHENKDSIETTSEISFWIKNKSLFGTFKGSLIIATTSFFIYLLIVIILRLISQLYALIFQFFYLGIIILFTIWSKRQISKSRDEFYIGEEFNVISKPGIAFVICWGLSIIIDPLFPPLSSIIATIISFLATSIGLSMYNVIGLYWAINKYFHVYKLRNMLQITDNKAKTDKNGNEHNDTIVIPINVCIQHNDGYYLFFEYLIGEISVENLEFVTDAIYIKHKFDVTKRVSIHKKHIGYQSETFEWPQLPSQLHQSEIMKCDKLYDAIMSINKLYVEENSLREINLSFKLREEMKRRMNFISLNEKTLNVDIFDKCIEEVLYLLQDAYSRFRATKQYKIFANAMK